MSPSLAALAFVKLESDCALCRVSEAMSELVFSTLMTSTPTAFSVLRSCRQALCQHCCTCCFVLMARWTPLLLRCCARDRSHLRHRFLSVLQDLTLICTIASCKLCFSRSRPHPAELPALLCAAAPPPSSWKPWHNSHPPCSPPRSSRPQPRGPAA